MLDYSMPFRCNSGLKFFIKTYMERKILLDIENNFESSKFF